MRPAAGLAALLAAWCAVEAHAQDPPAETIRREVARVNVGAIVTDSQGRLVEGLGPADFRVFDNHAEREITGFLSMDEPAQVALLIESGPAVLALGKNHLEAAGILLDSLAPADRVALLSYSKGPQMLLDFTADRAAARAALGGVSFFIGFTELNLSTSVASTLDWLATIPGKKTLVLLSTGVDTSPPEGWQLVQNKLRTSDVRILAVSLTGDFRKPAKKGKTSGVNRKELADLALGFDQADRAMREVSEATGGRAYFPRDLKDFAGVYGEIARLVRHDYSLAFAPAPADGQLHAIEVRVKRPGCRVDHRQAYLAPASSDPGGATRTP